MEKKLTISQINSNIKLTMENLGEGDKIRFLMYITQSIMNELDTEEIEGFKNFLIENISEMGEIRKIEYSNTENGVKKVIALEDIKKKH